MSEELTKQGYNLIIDRIMEMHVEPPNILTAAGLATWIQAYNQCQNEIIDLIGELRDKHGR